MLVYVIYTRKEIAKFSPRMLFLEENQGFLYLHLLCVYVCGRSLCVEARGQVVDVSLGGVMRLN